MKRILEASPVVGYQLFRFQGKRADGTPVVYPNYYIRHAGRTICAETSRLSEAKTKVKKMAGEDVLKRKRLTAPTVEVRVSTLLDLVIEDYKQGGQKTIAHAIGQIENSLRPYFGDMLAAQVDSDEIQKWVRWRSVRRLRKAEGRDVLQPASINRELSLLRRAFQLGYERNPQLADRIPPIKKLSENNVRKGFVTLQQYRAVLEALPEHLRGITCIAYHVANRKGELFRLEWSDVELDGNPPVFTLWPGETKNKDGRTLPILPGEMLETLHRLKRERDTKWPEARHVFLNAEGQPLAYHMMRKAWDVACARAGEPRLLFHDLRRSAVRNLRRAGVTQKVAREFSGHKTDAVFDRYNITDFDDLKDAAIRLGRFLGEPKPQSKVRSEMILSSTDRSTCRLPSIFVTGIAPRWINRSTAFGERPIYSAASARVKSRLLPCVVVREMRSAIASASCSINWCSNMCS